MSDLIDQNLIDVFVDNVADDMDSRIRGSPVRRVPLYSVDRKMSWSCGNEFSAWGSVPPYGGREFVVLLEADIVKTDLLRQECTDFLYDNEDLLLPWILSDIASVSDSYMFCRLGASEDFDLPGCCEHMNVWYLTSYVSRQTRVDEANINDYVTRTFSFTGRKG